MMTGDKERGRKRVNFIETDIQLLLKCVKARANILENKQTNAITINMKRKAWGKVLELFNASQIGGNKTLKELQNKYKNEKRLAKKQLSSNARELRKTDEGSAQLSETSDFGGKQINDLTNRFYGDATDDKEQEGMDEFDFVLESQDDLSDIDGNVSHNYTPPGKQKYSNKKIKKFLWKEELCEAKAKGLRLDNELKQCLIKKARLETRKLGLEIRKLEHEDRKLEPVVGQFVFVDSSIVKKNTNNLIPTVDKKSYNRKMY